MHLSGFRQNPPQIKFYKAPLGLGLGSIKKPTSHRRSSHPSKGTRGARHDLDPPDLHEGAPAVHLHAGGRCHLLLCRGGQILASSSEEIWWRAAGAQPDWSCGVLGRCGAAAHVGEVDAPEAGHAGEVRGL